ncbi:fungal Zn binuclear cluster domain-containing protein [Penicillium sp. IBT 35674x]|nr:fungal Zn binuclear cluster domain-containing protein [Penicillium sp. IBT 35674x]
MTPVSSAKLRTRTGCLQCRKRRKKCDEARPQCAGCSRNRLQCVWPSDKQRKDGRIRRISSEEKLISNGSEDGLSLVDSPTLRTGLRPPVQMPSPFQLEEHCYLYRYFGSVILPQMVRRNSLARYADQSYMLRLALEFPPLMGVLISIAGMKLASFNGGSIYCAVQNYIQTLNGLRKALSQMTDSVSNDALLATVITLSVFETSRLDTMLKVAPHVMASGVMLKQRRARWVNCPQASAVFDRICVESFVYHASLMMLFDPSLDSLSQPELRIELSNYFSDPVHGAQQERGYAVGSQPILHTSYEFFLLIADATKLARLSRPLTEVEIHSWKHLEQQLLQWTQVLQKSGDISALYILVLWVLLFKSHAYLPPEEIDSEIGVCVTRSIALLPLVDRNHYFTSSLVWPLAILGSVAILESEKIAVQNFMSLLIASSLGGQAAWILRRLKDIWGFHHGSDFSPSLQKRSVGLQALLDGHKEIIEHD